MGDHPHHLLQSWLRKIGGRRGRLEILKQSVKNMLKRNMPIDEIQEILEIPKEEIEKIITQI